MAVMAEILGPVTRDERIGQFGLYPLAVVVTMYGEM
jgi:hypothetical protein